MQFLVLWKLFSDLGGQASVESFDEPPLEWKALLSDFCYENFEITLMITLKKTINIYVVSHK